MTTRLLVITRNLPPLTGGMERLTSTLLHGLADDFTITVIAPPGAGRHLPAGIRVEECRSSGAAGFLLEAGLRIMRLRIADARPALVFAASGLTAPLAWFSALLNRCPFMVYLHGLDLVADSRVYQRLFVSRVPHAARVFVNSRNTRRLAIERGVAPDRLRVVNPGIAWPPSLPAPGDFRARHELGDGPVLLSVGRLTQRKGVAEFIEHCLPALLADEPSLRLVVVGQDAHQAIRREAPVSTRIKAAINRAGVAYAVRLIGQLDDTGLGAAWVSADVHILPVIPVNHDVEGFGMVAAEAAAHGLLTAAFAEGGVPDAVIAGVTGELVTTGDYAALAAAVQRLLQQARDPLKRAACREAAQAFDEAVYVRGMRAGLNNEADPQE